MAGAPFLPEEISSYILSMSLREPPILQRLREETAKHPRANLMIPPEHGQFMAFLIQLMRARRTIEIGVFTGYSALTVALALPEDGRIIACDISEEFTSVARRYWKEAGVDRKIDLRLKPAMQTLEELLAQGQRGQFDFIFIDADKTGYAAYYERSLELLRQGGLIMVDNVLWSGRVCDEADQTEETVALRAFNKKLQADSRIALSMLPLGDGVTLALKR
ncbi:MAG TPA: class I SAM-dependent methyltransferase [Bryobacteraceae bacterium]|nr:class I SAM-dependent methyltransferase [Bryobacteraceae bacterium]